MSELLRILKGSSPWLAVVLAAGLAVAYTFFNLHSAWNPATRLTNIRAGLVNEDEPVSVGGVKVAIGEELSRTLLEGKQFGWRTLSLVEAKAQLKSGALDFFLYIPKDASNQVVSLPSAATPQQPTLTVFVDPAYNYPMNQVADSVATAIRSELNGKVTATYLEQILSGLGGAVQGVTQAADGARQIDSGAGTLTDGAIQLHEGNLRLATGLERAAAGAEELAAGGTALREGAGLLVDGYDELADGNEDLRQGLNQTVAGVREIKKGVIDSLSQEDPVLAESSKKIEKAMRNLAMWHPYLLLDPNYRRLMAELKVLGKRADELKQESVSSLGGALSQLEEGLLSAADGSQRLVTGARQGFEKGQEFVAGARRLEQGARELSAGVNEALAGAWTLVEGADQLAQGMGQLHNGTGQLATGLGSATGANVPSVANAVAMSQPVTVVSEKVTPLPIPGEALLAVIIPSALWLGGLLLVGASRLLRAPWGMGETGWARLVSITIPGLVLTLITTGVAMVMGPQVKHPVLLFLFTLLASLSFIAVNQWLIDSFGIWGGWISGLLFILMPVAIGTRAPYILLPGIYHYAAPVLPLTHAIRGVQATVAGEAWGMFWVSVVALALFLGLSLVLSRWTGRSSGERALV